jgi:hypothetical protein
MVKGDPHPRRLHSMLFESDLERQPITEYTTRTQKYTKQQEFIDLIRSGEKFDMTQTENYRYWKVRKQDEKQTDKGRWTDEEILEHCWRRYELVRSIMEDGMREPILAYPNREGIDGGNRAQILKLLGYKSIIVRIV